MSGEPKQSLIAEAEKMGLVIELTDELGVLFKLPGRSPFEFKADEMPKAQAWLHGFVTGQWFENETQALINRRKKR